MSDSRADDIGVPPQPFLSRFSQRPELRRIFFNTSWLAGDRIIRMGVGLFVTSWIARYLGPNQFGSLNYAVAFVSLFAVLSGLGLDPVVIRALVQDPTGRDRFLCTAFFLKFSGAIVGFVIMMGTVLYVRTDSTTAALIAIIGLGTIVQTTDAIDFWFQSQVKSKWTVLAKNAAFFSVALFKILLLAVHAGLIWFAVASLLEIVIGAAGMIYYLVRMGEAPRGWSLDFALAGRLIAQSWPLFLAGVSVMIYMRIDQIMLERMAGRGAVGIYSAAVRISEMCYFVPMVIASSILPAIVRSRALGQEIYLRRMQKYVDLNAVAAVAVALPTSIAAGWVTRLLYGAQYHGVAAILIVHVWSSIFVFLGVARGQYLISEGHFQFTMFSGLAGAACNIVLNLFWIPRYAGMGAALATLVSYGVSELVSSFLYRKTFQIGLMQLRALFFPLSLRRLLRDGGFSGGENS